MAVEQPEKRKRQIVVRAADPAAVRTRRIVSALLPVFVVTKPVRLETLNPFHPRVA